jgi:hypothetical protein
MFATGNTPGGTKPPGFGRLHPNTQDGWVEKPHEQGFPKIMAKASLKQEKEERAAGGKGG